MPTQVRICAVAGDFVVTCSASGTGLLSAVVEPLVYVLVDVATWRRLLVGIIKIHEERWIVLVEMLQQFLTLD